MNTSSNDEPKEDAVVISTEARDIIENNPMAISTVMQNGDPNVIGVACIKVIEENKLLVTDVFMNQTLKDIEYKPKVAVVAWRKDMTGYKPLGTAKYYSDGDYFDQVKALEENKELNPKGAIVISVHRIIKSS